MFFCCLGGVRVVFLLFGRVCVCVYVFFCLGGGVFFCCLGKVRAFVFCCLGGGRVFFAVWAGDREFTHLPVCLARP